MRCRSGVTQLPNETREIVIPRLGGGGREGRGGNRFAPREKAKDARGTLKRLFAFYFKEAKLLALAFLLLVCNTAITVYVPRVIGRGVDAIAAGRPLQPITAALLFAYCASWALNIAQGVTMNYASQHIVRTLRRSLFDKFQALPLAYHDTHTHGELMSRMTNDVDNISSTIAQSTAELASSVVTILGTFAMMASLSIPLTAAAMVTIPFVYVLTRTVATLSRKHFSAQQTALGVLNGISEESIAGQKVIKAFGVESIIDARFEEANEALCVAASKAQIRSGVLMPLMFVITNLGYLCVAATGGVLILRGQATVGIVTSFLAYTRSFAMPLNNMASTFANLQSALAGAERVFEVLAEEGEPPDPPGAVEMANPKGEVAFEGVRFAYTPGHEVLRGISFRVSAGQRVALVGETGAGKTTIANLISRFYDPTSGTVYIDGLDVKSYRRDSLRNCFSVVLQDTSLFTGTIADNIRYGRPEASDEEVYEAARAGGAYEFIVRLKDGFATQISGESEDLSQGQRQLISISRAALCKAPILILDEATSNVDTRTEKRIQQAMRSLSESTSFIIAHRLSTIRESDVIFVLKNGEIIEEGDHETLLAAGGEYAAMYKNSF